MTEFEEDTVKVIFEILGSKVNNGRILKSLNGSLNYIGASHFGISTNNKTAEVSHINENDYISAGCYVCFRPNFGRKVIKFFVCYNYGADTFDLYVFKIWGISNKLIASFTDVYNDNLAQVVEHTYDELIKSECNGFISLG